jgi:lysyl endopeptidase
MSFVKPLAIAAAHGAAVLLIYLPAFADVQPASSLHPVRPLAEVAALALPAVDLADARAEDEVRELQGEPPRFAIPEPVAIDPETHGTWEELSDPRFLLWRLRVEVPEALSLNLGFDRFRLPKGARLVVHPAGGTDLARAYTELDNQPHGELWTPVILGGELVVELTLPAASRHDYELRLAQVGKGYRGFGEDRGEKAGWCNVDVVCPEGDPWREEISGVAVYTLNGSWTCSGVMVNNTAQDGTPYFLTANHCGIGADNAATMVVYWNFQSPVCGQQGGGSLARSQSGAIFRAAASASDFCLVELQALPDPAWEISYSGWDRTSADWPQAVAIHHPWTDEKSISFEYDPTTTTSYLESATPGNGTHIRVADWDLGTTEPGSSGSPLYNQNKHIVGQLHGGQAACGNDLADWYGRLSVSWTGGGTDATRLSTWLDPLGTAPLTLDTFNPRASGLVVSPSLPLSAQGDLGGPFTPASIEYTLENRGEASLSYAVTADQDWLGIAGGGGSLAPGATAVVTVSIAAAANALPVGRHTGEVAFTNLTDGDGDTVRPARLQVGVPAVVYSWNLDTDPGWSRQAAWAWGQPTGQGGQYGNPDPTSGYTGLNVLGYNLNGDYTNDMPEYALTTDAIDCSELHLVSLRYRRWLNVEQPIYDKASLRISTDGLAWTTIWENGSEITDSSWQLIEHNLSARADGQPTVYLRWVMGPTDSGWQYSGWNLDDIEIIALQATVTSAPGTPAAVTALLGAIPNPFNPLTEVRFTLARTQPARLAVHDARGRLVKVLVDGTLGAGPRSAVWDGTDEAGRRQGSGVYFLRLDAGEVRRTGKVVLVK